MTVFKALHKIVAALIPLLAVLAFGTPALAATASPGFTIGSFASPTNFSANDNSVCFGTLETLILPDCDVYTITATNAGGLPTEDTSQITLADALPEGLTVQKVSLYSSSYKGGEFELGGLLCSKVTVKCQYPGVYASVLPALEPDATLKMIIYVTVNSGAAGLLANGATVSGGGAPEAAVKQDNEISSSSPPFGPSNFGFYISGVDGAPETQAGDHPYGLTTTIELDNARVGPALTSVQSVKDIVVNLPLGFVGSTLAAPECTLAQLSGGSCPANTVVGHIETEPEGVGATSIDSDIYNLVPERGVPAEFGYLDRISGSHVFYSHVVPTSSGYVLQTVSPDIPGIPLAHIVVTYYGDPAQHAADVEAQRLERESGRHVEPEQTAAPPFFTLPTDCSGEPLTANVYIDSWQNPARLDPEGTPVDLEEPEWAKMQSESPPVSGCNLLQFPAEIGAQPTTHESDTPSGMNFAIKLPQTETVGVVARPVLRKVVETFPPGFTLDPSAGDGLAACSEAQIGWLGDTPGDPDTPTDFDAVEPECPEASKVGELELETPLIGARKLKGEIFLAKQNENPYPEPGHPGGSLIGLYVVVHDPVTGVLIKIAGKATLNANDGQITGEFSENPNLPFSNLELHFFGGPRASFATPESCGTFTTGAELLPYSFEEGLGESPTLASDPFTIDEACPNGGFNPSFTAGSMNLQAGAYTPFVASFERQDTDQELSGLQVALPPGLLADVGSVPECAEAQANAGTCPESSQVGTVQTGVGAGPDPLFVSGKAYLTGPYNGGPFGLAVVVPAVAGPFNFGTVVVRQSIRLNPYTAQVTDVSDAFPKIIDGIPLRLRRVDLTLNREGFMFNPTNCSKLAFDGGITGNPLGSPTSLNGTIGYATEAGASKAFTEAFQVTNCSHLKFTPKFSVSTSGKTSRVNGASLTAKLSYPSAPQGAQANIAYVKVDLPRQLPSRLTTLQKACTNAQFELNPAGCPEESKIGSAKVITPLLLVPLEGPAIFVSHGGEAFPSLTIVLQGDGVTIDLVGTTFISKAGITSTTFKTVPDTPFSTFELRLPQGKHSALAANGNLCQQNLVMPTAFAAQNGATLNQSTHIEVEGCPTALGIVSHTIKGHTLKLSVYAPSAGTVQASGKGLRRTSKTTHGGETLTLTLPENRPGGLKTRVQLSFTPGAGKERRKQTKSLAVHFRK